GVTPRRMAPSASTPASRSGSRLPWVVRFSAAVTLASGSASTSRTWVPPRAAAAARLIAVVVLPTPPFWLAISSLRTASVPPACQGHPAQPPDGLPQLSGDGGEGVGRLARRQPGPRCQRPVPHGRVVRHGRLQQQLAVHLP